MKTIKTIMMAAAIVLGTSTFASELSATNINMDSIAMVQAEDDGYVKVELTELNTNVQTAIANYTETYDITTLEYNAELKLTRVTLTAKSDDSVKIVILNEEGKEVEN